jgi:NAD(P)-dependent dehydrogenase (short-subunit alcohol dehydrogenase family)
VRSADDIERLLATEADGAIDRLVLNAGMQTVRPRKGEDGYELTFAVNHLAHFLLMRRLIEKMAKNSRIVFTSSGAHDPDEKTDAPAPQHADANLLAFPDRDPNRDTNPTKAALRAYSAAKLCNILTSLPSRRRER